MLFTLVQNLYKTKNGQIYSEIMVTDENKKPVTINGYKVSTNFNFKTLIYENEIICKLGGENFTVIADIQELGLKQIVNARLFDDYNRSLAMDSDSHNTGEPLQEKEK